MKKIFYILFTILIIKVLNNNIALVDTLINNTVMIIQSKGFDYFVVGMSVIVFDNLIKKVYKYFQTQYNKAKERHKKRVQASK